MEMKRRDTKADIDGKGEIISRNDFFGESESSLFNLPFTNYFAIRSDLFLLMLPHNKMVAM